MVYQLAGGYKVNPHVYTYHSDRSPYLARGVCARIDRGNIAYERAFDRDVRHYSRGWYLRIVRMFGRSLPKGYRW